MRVSGISISRGGMGASNFFFLFFFWLFTKGAGYLTVLLFLFFTFIYFYFYHYMEETWWPGEMFSLERIVSAEEI